MRWTKRNEDKPHRCPGCHGIPARCRRPYAPRTVASCAACGLKWRMGCRYTHRVNRDVYRLAQSAALYPHGWYLLDRIESERHAA